MKIEHRSYFEPKYAHIVINQEPWRSIIRCYSELWLLMPWCLSTRASTVTMLTQYPYFCIAHLTPHHTDLFSHLQHNSSHVEYSQQVDFSSLPPEPEPEPMTNITGNVQWYRLKEWVPKIHLWINATQNIEYRYVSRSEIYICFSIQSPVCLYVFILDGYG